MPRPLSETSSTTWRFSACRVTRIRPPGSVYRWALVSRLVRIWRTRDGSALEWRGRHEQRPARDLERLLAGHALLERRQDAGDVSPRAQLRHQLGRARVGLLDDAVAVGEDQRIAEAADGQVQAPALG